MYTGNGFSQATVRPVQTSGILTLFRRKGSEISLVTTVSPVAWAAAIRRRSAESRNSA